MVRKACQDIQVEVEFPEMLSKASLVKVLTDLMKNLLHQRNQIPLQYDFITKDIKAAEEVTEKKENEEPMRENIAVQSRAAARTNRQTARAAKTRAAYLKNSARLVREVEEMMNIIREEVENSDLVSISLLFGATPVSPREVFTIKIPQTTGNLASSARVGVHLFRAMVSNDSLHRLTSSRLPVSNTYLIFCKTNAPVTSSLLLLPSYSLPPSTRCPRVTFNIRSVDMEEEMMVQVEATRRLRFTSGASKPTPSFHECSPDLFAETVTISPVDKADKSDECDNIETVLRTSRKPELMELCTPLVRRVTSHPHVFCTPAPSHTARSSIQLSTPAPRSRGLTSIRPHTASMDICTPAPSNKLRENGVSLLDTPVSDEMVLCTPAVRTRKSDEMELCTPSVSSLELVQEQCLHPCDSNLDEKDSGISSPDCSIEESDNQGLFWFVTPAPIRGFK